jgi:hypothetical protein
LPQRSQRTQNNLDFGLGIVEFDSTPLAVILGDLDILTWIDENIRKFTSDLEWEGIR